jgi:hypothetical protein
MASWKINQTQEAQLMATKNCAKMEAFVKMMEVGIVPPPNATVQDVAATELANSRMRVLLETALTEIEC